jgi:hypothetical protein
MRIDETEDTRTARGKDGLGEWFKVWIDKHRLSIHKEDTDAAFEDAYSEVPINTFPSLGYIVKQYSKSVWRGAIKKAGFLILTSASKQDDESAETLGRVYIEPQQSSFEEIFTNWLRRLASANADQKAVRRDVVIYLMAHPEIGMTVDEIFASLDEKLKVNAAS